MKLLTERADFLVSCLDLPAAAQVDDAKWERFQIDHLCDDSSLRIEDKARQIAWSFTVAAEAVAVAMLEAESTIFVSINLEEAREKTRYAKAVYENLGVGGLPKIAVDNVLGLEFDNGSRILSLPSRPPRGKARMHIVLDEFAHIMHDKMIYVAALPIIARGGRLRLGSSPMGAAGMHWEISRQELRQYPGFVRVTTPWWKVRGFCKDGILPTDAEGLTTAERVERYGNERIQLLFSSMPDVSDFQQEHECVVVDESVSYFTWELIRKNQDEALEHWHVKDVDSIGPVVTEMKSAIAAGRVESVLVGGVDVGRKKHLTEIVLLGIGDSTPVRLMVSLDRVTFDKQEKLLRHVMQVLPIASVLIDENGIGMQLAENLAANTVAQGITFTNASKALWANELKIQMGRTRVPLPCDRDLAYQIHSVKQKVTAAKNVTYDTEANEKHHADKMWALALADWAAREHRDRPEWGAALRYQRR